MSKDIFYNRYSVVYQIVPIYETADTWTFYHNFHKKKVIADPE